METLRLGTFFWLHDEPNMDAQNVEIVRIPTLFSISLFPAFDDDASYSWGLGRATAGKAVRRRTCRYV